MNTEIQQLQVYYKGKKLTLNKDYILNKQMRQVEFKKEVNRRFVRIFWEIIK